jgi:protein TonB
MSTAALMLRFRPRRRLGPALRRFRLPFVPLVASATAHGALVVIIVAGAAAWRASQPKPHYVNLVPSVATVGTPESPPAPDLPPRTAPPTPMAAKELPPAGARELPARDTPAAHESPGLPESASRRVPALPRPGEKELSAVARAAPPRPTPPAATAPAPGPVAPPPPPPRGQAAGSPEGSGAITLNVSDFPYALYVHQLAAKIQEKWDGRALPGRQPQVVFEIGRDGQLRRLVVGKSSGNRAYDQVALRAVTEAQPFPPLPEEFPKPTLTVGLSFGYDPVAK